MFKKPSLFVYFICCTFLLGSVFLTNKFKAQGSQATISWDIAGYYLYLPSLFYDDIGKLNNIPYIQKEYAPFGGDFFSAYKQPNGSYVLKYTSGQAIMFLPAFVVAHFWAKYGGYPVDGFSYPYQISITLGCVFFAFIGLWFIRKALLKYFEDPVVALSLFILCFTTNYYHYVSFSALPHSNLFTLYAIMIYMIIAFYEQPTFIRAIILGLLSGLAIITRPTEIICILIIALWGVGNTDSFKKRIQLLIDNYGKTSMYIAATCLVGSIQLFYWIKYSGQLFHWSYGKEDSFSFLNPHILNGLISYRKGWFTYTPVMILSILGFIPLFKSKRNIFWACIAFTVVNIYIIFSWDGWWYGGSFSQRAVIQSYAVLLFPLSAFLTWALQKRIASIFWGSFILLCTWINLVMAYQVNGSQGIMYSDGMPKMYYWRILGKTSITDNDKKLLDTDEEMPRRLEKDLQPIFSSDFEHQFYNDSSFAYSGKKSIVLNKEIQVSPDISVPVAGNGKSVWYRVYVKTFFANTEWDNSKRTQFIVSLNNGSHELKSNMFRIQRVAEQGKWQDMFIDIYAPEKLVYDSIKVKFWHSGSETTIYMDDLKIMRATD